MVLMLSIRQCAEKVDEVFIHESFNGIRKKNKQNNKIKDMLINISTKETYITRDTIRNRFINYPKSMYMYF